MGVNSQIHPHDSRRAKIHPHEFTPMISQKSGGERGAPGKKGREEEKRERRGKGRRKREGEREAREKGKREGERGERARHWCAAKKISEIIETLVQQYSVLVSRLPDCAICKQVSE